MDCWRKEKADHEADMDRGMQRQSFKTEEKERKGGDTG